MARRNSHEPAELDPMFYLPEGMEDLSYGEGTYVDDEFALDDYDEDPLFDSYNDRGGVEADSYIVEDDADLPAEIDTPDTLSVVSQNVRLQPNGTHVVDVVVEVEDVPGAIHYEFRAVKI